MGQDHSKRTCGGPNPLVVQLRAEVARLEGVIEGGKKTIEGLEGRIAEMGDEAAETARRHGDETDERNAMVAMLTEETNGRAARIQHLEQVEAEANEELAALRPANEELGAHKERLEGELAALTEAHAKLGAEHAEMSAEFKVLRDSVEEEAIAQLESNMQRSQERQSTGAEHQAETAQLREKIRVLEEQAGLDRAANENLEFKISRMDTELFGLRSLVGEDAALSVQKSAAKNMGFYEKDPETGLSPYLERLKNAAEAGGSGALDGGDGDGDGGNADADGDPKALAAQIWGQDDLPTPPVQPDSPVTD